MWQSARRTGLPYCGTADQFLLEVKLMTMKGGNRA